MADVPLGMFLSGGIDSSAIAAVMSEMVKEPIKTFSVAFEEREANELDYARIVARAFKTDHHEIVVSPEQFFDVLPSLVYQEDEPIAHPSSIPLYFVSHLASEHVKVVLTGEGSDELIAGYDKYRKTVFNLSLGRAYHNLLPSSLRRLAERAIRGMNSTSRMRRKLSRTFLCLKPEIQEIYFDNFSVFSRAMQPELFTARTRERMGDGDPYRASLMHINQSDATSLLDQLLAADLKTYLHELLMKQDQMSMAASIESRVPFLDHKLVEFVSALPARMKLRGLTTKYILRRSMRNRLPKEILTRKKMGFPVPVGAWLRGPFRHVLDEYVLGSRARERAIFDSQFVQGLVARHLAGEDHTERLWMLINFEVWQRRFIERRRFWRSYRDRLAQASHRIGYFRLKSGAENNSIGEQTMGIVGGSIGYKLLRSISSDGETGYLDGSAYNNRSKTQVLFGPSIWDELAGKVVIDFGCGTGAESVEIARRGAARVIGLDIRERVLDQARVAARKAGVADRCVFTTRTDERADIVLSMDAFEHFEDPAGILLRMERLVKDDGKVLIEFGPPWYHPLGGHLFSVFPWAHLIFSERALIRWRSDFRSDGATRFCEIDGGLNQMTLRRFKQIIAESPFEFLTFEAVPIRRMRPFSNFLTREFLTSIVRSRLVRKPSSNGKAE